MSRGSDVRSDAVLAYATGVLGVVPEVSRTLQGVSSVVYRLDCDDRVAYLRLGEIDEEDLTTDALLLERLGQLGVSVPEVIDVVPFHERLGRSVLIMTEVAGDDLGKCDDETASRRVVYQAGAELAVLNSVEVDGWGWVIRDGSWPVRGTWKEQSAFVGSELPDAWPGRLGAVLTTKQLDALGHVFAEVPASTGVAHLAHGDFDCTHIFQAGGSYTGLIDFGEIRGTEPTFDLGHFLLHDGETARWLLFGDLLAGYASVNSAPTLDVAAIERSALQLGTRQLARWMNRVDPAIAATIPIIQARVQKLDRLLYSHV